ncbi:hypothetical protein COV18_02725 [Candidatus Woesearchaeota archaeon CG10_big_fil_rev_8_21_14_0_10_37_12]|nr:MAG: hypothetical protein COV18_02725 [Candidatus Woesearchaeota archaeon CG10_big_fil_rev_8_21_14_0_10_37_12]
MKKLRKRRNLKKTRDIADAFAFFKLAHEGHTYPEDGRPYWPHIYRVGCYLQRVIKIYGELDKDVAKCVVTAGFGHDSLEDTALTAKEIESKFGNLVLELIVGMTNQQGDSQTASYVEQICSGREELRLIKLSDLYDNYTTLACNPNEDQIISLGRRVLPIMEPMYDRIRTTKFRKYPKTGNYLLTSMQIAHDLAVFRINAASNYETTLK